MRIVRIVPFLNFGGVEKRMELTAKGFLEYPHHELIVVVLSTGGKAADVIQSMGFQVIVMNMNPRIPNIKLIYDLIKILRKLKPDVVHCSGSEANFHGLWAAFWVGVSVRVGEEIGFPQHNWKWRKLFWLTYLAAHKVIGISEAVKDRIINFGEVMPNKVQVVYNPVELMIENQKTVELIIQSKDYNEENFNSTTLFRRPTSAFVFVTTCRLVPIKNLEKLIKVFELLINSNRDKVLELWIVGDGQERDKLDRMVLQLGLEKNIILFGFQEDVIRFLTQADAFVLPSMSEGFSISLVEAMSCGLPCIATKVGGPSEIIKSGTGYLIDPNSSDDIFQKMDHLVNMPLAERKEMGRLAKKDVEMRFTVKKYVKALLFNYRTT